MPRANKKKTEEKLRRQTSIILLALAFAVMMPFVVTGQMGPRETWVFQWIYGMPDSLEWFARLVTQLGSVWFVVGVVGLLFVVKWNPLPALIVLRNSIIAYAATFFFKTLVERPRPIIFLSDITAREMVTFGDGFPSGHTALATVAAITLLPYFPRSLRWVPFVWIVLVAWSRIYLGVHAPLDVVGGFVLGLLVVLLAEKIPWPKRKKA
jgi:undecaprenyl-diphosphatase